jgi:hypothetical protein
MKNSPIVQLALRLHAGQRVRPFTLSLCEFDEVGDGDRSHFGKQSDNDLAFGGVEDGVCAGGQCHENSYVSFAF